MTLQHELIKSYQIVTAPFIGIDNDLFPLNRILLPNSTSSLEFSNTILSLPMFIKLNCT